MADLPSPSRFDISRWVAGWQGRIADAAANGGGLDEFRQGISAARQISDSLQRAQANVEIWDAAVRHLEDSVGLATLSAIYTAVTNDMPPGTQYDLDEGALRDEERRDAAAEVERLARLPAVDYEQVRREVADQLGLRAGVLDVLVKASRKAGGETKGQGRPLKLPEIVPCDEPVDGAELLDLISTTVQRFVVLPAGAAEAVALWSVATHCFQQFDVFPRLTVRSATPQCGKTTLRDIVAALVPKPVRTDSIMAAALFRTIEMERPTLLLDEAETYLSKNEELRGIINSGHRRDGQVIRCVGDDHEPRQFSTWAPILLAQIGNPPATVYDRSIVITLSRKRTSEPVESLTSASRQELGELARKAARWTVDYSGAVAAPVVALPGISDRANDNWRALLAVADLAGGDWPERARAATKLLAEVAGHDAASVGEMLIADIYKLLFVADEDASSPASIGRITSSDLAERLAGLEGRPWAEWKAGKPITPNGLARQLKPFHIQPRTIRFENGATLKGYKDSDFADVFERYGLSATVTPSQLNKDGHFSSSQTVTVDRDVTVVNCKKPNNGGDCDGVTVQDPNPAWEEVEWTV